MKREPKNVAIVICAILWVAVILIYLLLFLTNPESKNVIQYSSQSTTSSKLVLKELEPGGVFTRGSYIEFANTKITYDGESFIIENNSDSRIIVTCSVYGKKKNGTYEFIGMPAFYGFDEEQYKKDKEENGWAIKKTTNQVNSRSKLIATMEMFDFGDDYPSFDIDGDGYYDIAFTVHPQKGEGIRTSTSDPMSDYYRLRVTDK